MLTVCIFAVLVVAAILLALSPVWAALSAAKETRRAVDPLVSIPLLDEAVIWKGALVNHDATTGTLKPAADTENELFAGVAAESVDNTGGSEAGKSCRVYKTGVFDMKFGAGSAANAHLGKLVYVTDDESVDLVGTTTYDIAVGHIVGIVDADNVRVRITGYA